MIRYMGSKTELAILNWMKDRSFTRNDVETFLETINFSDPFETQSRQSPLTRIMQTIIRKGLARVQGRVWASNDEAIDREIRSFEKYQIPEAEESFAALMQKVRSELGNNVNPEMVKAEMAFCGKMRR